jgi:glycosyltransferase involved in cell wall biosynthesis
VESILAQSFEDFELIIVNDGSTDDTDRIVRSFDDGRIRYFRRDANSGSIGAVRKYSVTLTRGKYVFFTDSDCHPAKTWLEEGFRALENHGTDAIEGKVVYHEIGYKPSLSDKPIMNSCGGEWMTSNMAFRREALLLNPFSQEFSRLDDRDLALRIRRKSAIPFVESCIVYHRKKKRTVRSYLRESLDARDKVVLVKLHGDRLDNPFRIVHPKLLLTLIFPFMIFAEFLSGKIRSMDDLRLLPFVYVKAVYIRFLVWKTALKEKVLLF